MTGTHLLVATLLGLMVRLLLEKLVIKSNLRLQAICPGNALPAPLLPLTGDICILGHNGPLQQMSIPLLIIHGNFRVLPWRPCQVEGVPLRLFRGKHKLRWKNDNDSLQLSPCQRMTFAHLEVRRMLPDSRQGGPCEWKRFFFRLL